MQLAIFDIDGTLSRTPGLATKAYALAFKEELDVGPINTKWSDYTYCTDSGIFTEIFEMHLGRLPQDDELDRVRRCYFKEYIRLCDEHPNTVEEISGAAAFFNHLREHAQWAVAVATGNWDVTGKMKLARGGIEPDSLPSGFADDSFERHEIIDAAHKRALKHHERDSFDRVIYIGDGPWDVKASRKLGINFLGVRGPWWGNQLEEAGARHFINDYSDIDAVLAALHACEPPA